LCRVVADGVVIGGDANATEQDERECYERQRKHMAADRAGADHTGSMPAPRERVLR
jgi:hypothetical protein